MTLQRRPLVAGNWKMHKCNAELGEFFSTFISLIGPGRQRSADVMLAAPYPLLARTAELGRQYAIRTAAQNVHEKSDSAHCFTLVQKLSFLSSCFVTSFASGSPCAKRSSSERAVFGSAVAMTHSLSSVSERPFRLTLPTIENFPSKEAVFEWSVEVCRS